MIELSLLGTPELRREGDAINAVLVQPRRLALLAYLAVSKGAFQRRDRLLLLFWGDMPESRGRASLRQALHFIRRSLGDDVIVTRGQDEVGLNPDTTRVDVTELEHALAERRAEDALALYRGDFLADFNVDNAPEFERWAGERRREYRRAVVDAAWQVSDEALEADSREAALTWARRAIDLADYAEGDVRRAMRTSSRAGDRSAALEIFETLRARLASDLETRPEPATLALANALKTEGATGSFIDDVLRPTPTVAPAVVPLDAVVAPSPVTAESARRRFSSRAVFGAAASVIACVFAGALLFNRSNAAEMPGGARTIAVMPFTIRGGNVTYLRDGMVDLLSISLQGAGDVEVVEPLALLSHVAHDNSGGDELKRARATARTFSAGNVVMGTIVDVGGNLNARVALYSTDDRSDEPIAIITGTADEANVVHLVDDITRSLLAATLRSPAARLSQLATQTTTSLPALKSYLRGEDAMRTGQYTDAADAYENAVALDTSFALAYYGLSMAKSWSTGGADHDATRLAAAAVLHSHGLSAHDSLLLAAHAHNWSGKVSESEAEYRSLLASFPTDVEAWHELGEVLFHGGWIGGHPIRDARAPFERVTAIDAFRVSALDHLARIAAAEMDSVALDSLASLAGRAAPADPRSAEIALLRAVVKGSSTEREIAIAKIGSRSDRDIWLLALDVANYAAAYPEAEAMARLLTAPEKPSEVRAIAWSTIAQFRAAAGRPAAARAAISETRMLDARRGAYIRAYLTAIPFFPSSREDLISARREIEGLSGLPRRKSPDVATLVSMADLSWLELELLDGIDVRLGRKIAPRSNAIARMEWQDTELIADAVIANQPKDTATARAYADRFAYVATAHIGWPTPRSETMTRFARADLLEMLGRYDEAERWFNTFPAYHRDELMFRTPATLRLARLAARRGDRATAARLNQRAAWMWRDAEPEFRRLCIDATQPRACY